MGHYLRKELYDLIKSEERIFDFIQDGSLDGLWYWDLENPEDEWMNNRFWQVLGYNPKEMPHKVSSWQNLVNPDDLKVTIEAFEKHLADPSIPYDQEVRYKHKNGSTVWVRCRGLIIKNKEGKPVRMLGAHQDITSLKNAEEQLRTEHKALKEKEELYRFLTENTTDVIRYQNTDGSFSYVSPNIEELSGYTPEEYKCFGPLENVYSEDHKLLTEVVEKFQTGEDVQTVEYRIIHKNGHLIWVETRIKAIRDTKGALKSLLSSTNDISEQKKLSLQLAASEEKYKAMYNNAPLAFQSLNIDGNIIEVNPQWLTLLEYSKEEVIGKWFGSFLHPDFVEHFRANFPRFKKQGFINDVQFRMVTKSGRAIYVSFEGCIGYTPEGKFKQTYCTFKDITTEKEAELKLKESELNYRLLAKETADNLSNLKVATNITTVFLDKELNVFQFTPSSHSNENIDKSEMLTISGFAKHFNIPNLNKLCLGVLKSLKAIEKEVQCSHDLVWWMRISPYKTLEGNINGLVITFTDITEKKNLDTTVSLLSQALENSMDAYNIIDEKGNLVYVNKAYLKMWGYKHVDDVLGQAWRTHCLDPEIPDILIQQVLAEGKMEKEFKASRKDGSLFDVFISVTKHVDNHGKLYFSGFSKDITLRKQQEIELQNYRNHLEELVDHKNKALSKSESRYKQLVETAADAIYLINEKGIVIDINKQAMHLLGKERNELIGKTIDVIDPNFSVETFLAFWKPIPFFETRTFESSHIGINGNIIPIEVSGQKYKLEGETFYFGIARDISERKEAEKEFKNQRDLFELVINSVPSLIFWKDLNLNYLGCNSSFAHYAGLENPKEIIGKSDSDMVWATDANNYNVDDVEVIKSGLPKLNYEENVIDYLGRRRILQTNKMPLKNRNGEVFGVIATCEDITEQKKAEEAFVTSQKRYQSLFDNAPTPIWEEDFSEVKKYLTKLQHENNKSFEELLETNPQILQECAKLVKVIDFNRAVLELHDAVSKEDLATDLNNIMSEKSAQGFSEGLKAVINGETECEYFSIVKTLKGEEKHVLIKWLAVPGYEENLERVYVSTIDLSEQKRAEQNLADSLNLLNTFVDNFPDDAWAKDLTGRITLANQFVKKETLKTQSVIGKTVFDFFPKNVAEELWNEERHILNSGEASRVEEKIPRHDGDRNKIISKFPLYNSQGEIIGLGGVAHDITERKKAEQALKVSEGKFRGVFEDSNVGIALGTPEGTVVEVNDEYLRITGYLREEFISLNFTEITHPDDLAKEMPLFEELHNGEITNYRIEKRLRAKNGAYIWLDSAISARKNSKGVVDQTLAVVIDITEAKNATETVNAFFEQPLNIHLIANANATLLKVNKGWEEILGYTKEETVGKNVSYFVHSDEVETTEQKLKELRKGKAIFYFENRFKHKNGNYVTLAWSIIYNEADEQMLGVAKDVTEQKDYQEKLKNIIDNSTNLFYSHSTEHQITFMSPQVEQFLGYTTDEVAQNWINFVTDNPINQKGIELTQKAIETGERQPTYELELQRKDKTKILVEVREAPVTVNGKVKSIVGSLTDITQRKAFQAALLRSKENYKALAENSKHLIIKHNTKGKILYANKFARQYLSPLNDNIVGEDIKSFIVGNDLLDYDKNIQMFKNDFDANFHHQFELELKIKANEHLYLDVIASPIILGNDLDSILVTAYDVTERKIAEEQILKQNEEYEALNEELIQTNAELRTTIEREEASNERFNLAMEATSDGLFDWDIQSNSIYFSPRWKSMLGYKDEELINDLSVWEKLTKPDDIKRFWEKLDALVEGQEEKFDIEFQMKHKKGYWVDINSRANVFFDKDGYAYRVVGTHIDVTERKQAENKIRENEEKLRLAIDNSPLGISINDMDGNFLSVNKAYENLVGYSSEELMKMGFYDITHPDYLPENRKQYTAMVTQRTSGFIIEKKYIRKNGTTVDVRIHVGSIKDKHGEVLFGMAFSEDITKFNKTMEDLKLAKNKAEEANKLKTEFLHNMSHEIRTPMNGIMGFSSLLCELDGCSEKQKNYSSIIRNSSTQLLSIIDDILEISTLETKQLSLQESEFDINQFVMELYSIYDLKAKERNLPLYIKKGLPNENCIITSDKVKLNKILSNLLDNAFKFTNSGFIELGYAIQDSKIVFHVKDTGIGVANDKLDKIFERFSQESSSTAQTFGGLGLGLSIAKENAELLGGRISITSEKDRGTTFFVETPFKASEETKILAKKLANEPHENQDDLIPILIAEDEETNFLYIEAVLEQITDYKVLQHHATNGEEAVQMSLSDDNIKLVLMDIKMPIMDGYEATRLLKAKKPNLPIIALTAYSTPVEEELALENGCDAFLSKPINKNKLLQVLNEFLNK